MRTLNKKSVLIHEIPKPLYLAVILSLILSYILYKWDMDEGFNRKTASIGVSTGILFSTDIPSTNSENP